MPKYITSLLLTCVLLFPVVALASDEVPQAVQKAIEKDLENYKKSIMVNGEFKIKTSKEADNIALNQGLKVYFINGKFIKSGEMMNKVDDILHFGGYAFPIHSGSVHNGVVFTDEKGTEIIGVYSDFKFVDQFEKAKRLVGFDENSKVIYDDRLSMVVLISNVDGKDVVVPLRESSVLEDLKPFKEYNLQEFKEMLDVQAAKQAKENADSDPADPRSGGSPSSSVPATEHNAGKITLLSAGGLAVIAGAVLIARKRKTNE